MYCNYTNVLQVKVPKLRTPGGIRTHNPLRALVLKTNVYRLFPPQEHLMLLTGLGPVSLRSLQPLVVFNTIISRSVCHFAIITLCPRRESNPHTLRYWPLEPARLPFRHLDIKKRKLRGLTGGFEPRSLILSRIVSHSHDVSLFVTTSLFFFLEMYLFVNDN